MKSFLSKQELGNNLLFDTLSALYRVLASKNLDLIIVGASARDLALKLLGSESAKRRTADLDVAVALKDWSQYDALADDLKANYFKKMSDKQKFAYKGPKNDNDYEVDVVPFGDIANNELIKWPPMGCPEMSVRCYNDVMKHLINVTIEDLDVKIAPLAGQFIIKLDTWIDRNDRENKDAIDMRFILSNYYLANIIDTDTIPDVITMEIDSMLLWGAQWIAYQTSYMLSTKHLSYYVDFLRSELSKEEGSRLLQHLNIGFEESPEEWESMKVAMGSMLGIWEQELERRH